MDLNAANQFLQQDLDLNAAPLEQDVEMPAQAQLNNGGEIVNPWAAGDHPGEEVIMGDAVIEINEIAEDFALEQPVEEPDPNAPPIVLALVAPEQAPLLVHAFENFLVDEIPEDQLTGSSAGESDSQGNSVEGSANGGLPKHQAGAGMMVGKVR